MEEMVIKVPAPFPGVQDLGFSARYPAQAWNERLRDVTLIIEGPPRPMARLVNTLNCFADKNSIVPSADDEAYSWTQPVQLTDEVCVMAFRDQSLAELSDPEAGRGYVWNLVRPMAFTFLRDCVRLGQLRIADRIAVIVDPGHPPVVDLELLSSAITPVNGSKLLAG